MLAPYQKFFYLQIYIRYIYIQSCDQTSSVSYLQEIAFYPKKLLHLYVILY